MVIEKIGAATSAAPLSLTPTTAAKDAAQAPGVEFGKMFEEFVGKVGDLQVQADNQIQDLATGKSRGLHEVMLAVEKANISFQMLTQVRNKAVDAYQEIMRMQV